MTGQEVLDYKAEQFDPMLRNQIDTDVEVAFENAILQDSDAIEEEMNEVSADADKEAIRKKHADQALHQASSYFLES